jgi:hypothetical protein
LTILLSLLACILLSEVLFRPITLLTSLLR